MADHPFEFPCGACGIPIATGGARAGTDIACPTCGSAATVPAEPPRAPERSTDPVEVVPYSVSRTEPPDWVLPFWLKAAIILVAALWASCAGLCIVPRPR